MNGEDFIDTKTGFCIPYNELVSLICYPMCQIVGRYGVWDLQKCILSESDQKLVDSNICHKCGNDLRTESIKDDYYFDEIWFKICGTCGNIVVVDLKILEK